MAHILEYIAKHLSFLFDKPMFCRFVDSSVDADGRAAQVVLESESLRLVITYERGQGILEFKPRLGGDQWYSPGVIMGLLTGRLPQSEVLDSEWGEFLRVGLPEIEMRMREPESARYTVAALDEQIRARTTKFFGWPPG